MKTLVRVIHGEYRGAYKELFIQVLESRHGSRFLEPIGQFQWQAGDANGKIVDEWYAFKAVCETDRPETLVKIAKLLKYIKTLDARTPQDVMSAIGAEEHQYICGQYVSIKLDGGNVYEIWDDGSPYARAAGLDERDALRRLKKHNRHKPKAYVGKSAGGRPLIVAEINIKPTWLGVHLPVAEVA